MVVDDALVDDPLSDRGGDAEMEHENGDKIEECGQHHRLIRLQDAGRYHGRDRVRRVVKAVHEVEQQRHDHDTRQYAEAQLAGGARVHQEFSSTMPSTMFATSSQRSVIVSSRS